MALQQREQQAAGAVVPISNLWRSDHAFAELFRVAVASAVLALQSKSIKLDKIEGTVGYRTVCTVEGRGFDIQREGVPRFWLFWGQSWSESYLPPPLVDAVEWGGLQAPVRGMAVSQARLRAGFCLVLMLSAVVPSAAFMQLRTLGLGGPHGVARPVATGGLSMAAKAEGSSQCGRGDMPERSAGCGGDRTAGGPLGLLLRALLATGLWQRASAFVARRALALLTAVSIGIFALPSGAFQGMGADRGHTSVTQERATSQPRVVVSGWEQDIDPRTGRSFYINHQVRHCL